MSTSLNGWPGIPNGNSPELATGLVPGTTKHVTLQKDALPLFLAFLADWHKTVHSIEYHGALGPDGWEYRDARTGAGLSNHASGTAVDITYDWLKADHARHMNATQIAAVHALLGKYVTSAGKRVFGWGGDWTVGKYCDEMHVELIQSFSPGSHGSNCTLGDVKNVITRLRIQPDGTVKAPPIVSIPPFKSPFTVGTTQTAQTKAIQTGLGLTVDGQFGPRTLAAVSAYQKKYRLRLLLPKIGVVDARTYKALARPI